MKRKTKKVIIGAGIILIAITILFLPTIMANGQDEIKTVTGSAGYGIIKADFEGNIHQDTISGVLTYDHYAAPVTIYLSNLPPTFKGMANFENEPYSISGMYIRLGDSIKGVWTVKGFSGGISLNIV